MLHFIYNPYAGKGKAPLFRSAIEARLKREAVAFFIHETQCVRDGTRIARELTEKGETDIIAVGGDGTVNEVLNGLVDPSKVKLGIIPCGSGNDFAAMIGIPMTADGALEVILNHAPKPTDYLECSGIRGLNVIGAGIDVEVLKRSYRSKILKGSLNYYMSLLISVIRFTFYRFTTDRDGRTGTHNGLIVCACNGRRIGGGIGICPDAQYDDGQLDIVIVQDLRKRQIPMALIKLMQGKILQQRYTLHERGQRLQVRFAEPATIQIDGELYDDLDFDVRIISNQLRIYRP